MPLLYMKRYTRAFIREHPDWLFVFGDNFARKGYGGQAAEARDEPNAIGVPTKRYPTTEDAAFLGNEDFEIWEQKSRLDRQQIEIALREGKIVVWPLDGIGSGRAKLAEKAPDIAKAIEEWLNRLETIS
jgi:hypothetical protein